MFELACCSLGIVIGNLISQYLLQANRFLGRSFCLGYYLRGECLFLFLFHLLKLCLFGMQI